MDATSVRLTLPTPQTTGTFVDDLDQGVHLFWAIALPVSCKFSAAGARFLSRLLERALNHSGLHSLYDSPLRLRVPPRDLQSIDEGPRADVASRGACARYSLSLLTRR